MWAEQENFLCGTISLYAKNRDVYRPMEKNINKYFMLP